MPAIAPVIDPFRMALASAMLTSRRIWPMMRTCTAP
jgi:hypothetical protein